MSESLSTENERTREWTIPIRGVVWSVRVVTAEKITEIAESTTDAWGLCDESTERIYLNEKLLDKPRKFLRKILFHEVAHARLNLIGQLDTYNDEVLADVLGEDEWEIACYVTANLPTDWR